MTPDLLPPFPVDAETLDLVETAIAIEGVSVLTVLDLLSGQPEQEHPVYHFTDVISALITEVRRLREKAP